MVVIFTDGSVNDIQALYLLLSREDIHIDGIVVETCSSAKDIAICNVLQILALMERAVNIYLGSIRECNASHENYDINLCTVTGNYNIVPHDVLMNIYKGDVVSLGMYDTMIQWLQNGSITSLTIYIDVSSTDKGTIDLILNTDIPKKVWMSDMIPYQLVGVARAISISNSVLRKTLGDLDKVNEWNFDKMIIMMDYLGYIE
jgi:hypothetical protein